MTRLSRVALLLVLLGPPLLLPGCSSGPSIAKEFDRDFTVSGPVRLEISNASGDVQITGSADGKVHVHGTVRSAGMHFGDAQKAVTEAAAHPPVELKADTVRIGKDVVRLHNVSVVYKIEVPRNTEVTASVASGSPTVSDVIGPVRIDTASGSIHVDKVQKSVQASTASGSVEVSNTDDDVRATTASGNITTANTRGDVRATTLSGKISVGNPGGRVEASNASGSIDIQGAANDVKAQVASGHIRVAGNPSANGYWDIQTASGNVEVSVPAGSNFHLSASNTSGEISADIPVVIEEQGKHTLRAHVGDGGGRVEIHTVSGKIHFRSSN
ncbi:MAG TPA: DUF4097 family beta strand repeat-containing protein [Candidatus Saccharimonadales bacterium]|nr:DUF4097 family beta strand repeat-containing protein [Candidatus Saccharimonadales bacterium]